MDGHVRINLTWTELRFAAFVGIQRNINAMMQNRLDVHGRPPDPWGVHINGAAAEMAVAKALDKYWPAATQPDRDGDVGPLHVRSTEHPDGCLILHDSDPDDGLFVLATGTPPAITLAGWMRAGDGKTPEFWRTDVRKPCYMIPQARLEPMTPA